MPFLKKVFAFLLLIIICTLNIYAQTKASDDPLLQILQSEVQKNKARFDQDNTGVYLLSYRVEDRIDHNLKTSLGSLLYANNTHKRILTVQVRIGDYNLDNFHELRDDYSNYFTYVEEINLPLNDDSKAIAQLIWKETDRVFREAQLSFEKVKANVAVKSESEDHAPDFSYAPQVVYFEEAPIDTFYNQTEWTQRLKALSAVFSHNTDVQKGTASFSYSIVRKYYVNSEKTSIVENNSYCHLHISAEGQADDGMVLPLYKSFFAHQPQEMPEQKLMMKEAELLNSKISQLVKAPVVDSYNGPAILSKDAAGVFFHEIFGHRVEGQRMKGSEDGQTFKKKVGEQVLPEDLSVVFDPSITYYEGIPLNGSYKFDDEGFQGYTVTTVDHGILKNFLMSRTPIDGAPMSNGHARAAAGKQPVSRQSNLIVETAHPYTDAELRAKLIAEAKAQGKEYAYFFATVEGGFTTTGRYMPNSFNVSPLEVYRIYVDGRPDELVRGVDLVGTPLSMFSQIVAAGDSHGNFAGRCGAESGSVPAGCCSPALFVKNIEMQKKSKSQERPPIIRKNYSQISDTTDFESICFEAMEDEIGQNMVGLTLPNLKSPYFISYLISDAEITDIESSLGGIISSSQKPYRSSETSVLVGNDKCNNLHYADFNSIVFSGSRTINDIPIEDSYSGIRHNLWYNTDIIYKKAAERYEAKQAAIKQQNLPEEDLSMGDRSNIVSKNNFQNLEKEKIDVALWEVQLNELSNIFINYPEINTSKVNFYSFQANAYYLDNEGLKYKQPFHIVNFYVYAETMAPDGQVIKDYFNIPCTQSTELPTMEELKRQINDFATQLSQLRQAPIISESYDGPVILVDQAAADATVRCLLSTNGILAGRKPVFSNHEFSESYGSYFNNDNPNAQLIGKKIISRDFTLKTHNTWSSYNHIPLIGNFAYDAEGYQSEEEQIIIEDGLLMQLLSSREPCPSAPFSNGHKRLGISNNHLSTTLMAGVLELTSDNTTSYNKLKKKLMKLSLEEGYSYGYIITKLDEDGQPQFCYRINAKTGEEELVRMANMTLPSIKAYKHIACSTNEQQVYNSFHCDDGIRIGSEINFASAPISLILPKALLFEELGIRKDNNAVLQKAPFIDNPLKQQP